MNSTKEEEQPTPVAAPVCFIVMRSEPWRWAKLKSTGVLPPWKVMVRGDVSFVTLEQLRCRLGQDGIHHPDNGGIKLAAQNDRRWTAVNPWTTELVYGEDLPTAQEIAEILIAERVG